MDISLLSSLGLTKNAATIYLALLKAGQLKAGELIKETKMQRSVVYLALEELVSEKLVIKNTGHGVARFEALPPAALVERAERQTQQAEQVAQTLQAVAGQVAPTIAIQQGLAALHKAFYGMLDELKPGEEYFTLGTNLGTYKEPLKTFFFEFNQKRVEKGVAVNVLCYKNAHKTVYEAFQRAGDKTGALSRVKILPVNALSPLQINLFKNKVMIIIQDEQLPSVMVFERKDMFEGFKAFFDAFWQISR